MAIGPRTVARSLGVLALGALLALPCVGAQAEQLESWRAAGVPELTRPDLDGATVNLGAERGKIIIVHFFATWCEPCRDELRSLEQLAAALEKRPFRILAVDVGEPADRVRRFLERHMISVRYPVLIDFDKQAMRAWSVEMLPMSYVLDGALCPLWKVAGALEWGVGPTRSAIEAAVVRIEQAEGQASNENCSVKGETQ